MSVSHHDARVIDNYLQQRAFSGVPDFENPDFKHLFFDPLASRLGPNSETFASHYEYSKRMFQPAEEYSLLFQKELMIDFDWRFSNHTIQIIENLALEAGRILFIGAPMPYFYLVNKYGIDGTLIDANNLYGNLASPRLNVISKDIHRALIEDVVGEYDTVIMDPPWSRGYIPEWTRAAMSVLRQNGNLVTTMFPPFVRPTARYEMQNYISDMTRHFLSVSHYYSLYNTPHFEKAIFARKRIPVFEQWRRGMILVWRGSVHGPIENQQDRLVDSDTGWWTRSVREGITHAWKEDSRDVTLDFSYVDTVSSRSALWSRIRLIDSENWAGVDVGSG